MQHGGFLSRIIGARSRHSYVDKDSRDLHSGFRRLYAIQILLKSLTELSRDLLFSTGMIRSPMLAPKLTPTGLLRSLLYDDFDFGEGTQIRSSSVECYRRGAFKSILCMKLISFVYIEADLVNL